MDLITSVCISAALMVYYSIFFTWDYLIKAGKATNSPNKTIAKLMTDYNVNIRTFQKNNIAGFAWFGTIWINENAFKNKRRLLYIFHHEHYHITHNHKAWKLTMRYAFALLPISLSFVHWSLFTLAFIGVAVGIDKVVKGFEKKANEHAFNEISKNAKKGQSINR